MKIQVCMFAFDFIIMLLLRGGGGFDKLWEHMNFKRIMWMDEYFIINTAIYHKIRIINIILSLMVTNSHD